MVVDPTAGPRRTCVGCRQRTAAAELLRIVVAPDAIGGAPRSAVPDPHRRIPGRGAWVHPVGACVELAERRRAFGRALRVSEPINPVALHEYVAAAARSDSAPTSVGARPAEHVGDTSNERSMKRQQ